MRILIFGIIAIIALACTSDPRAETDVTPPPPPPADVVPDLRAVNPRIQCVACDEPFDIANHGKLLEELAVSPYIKQLRWALYRQDLLHQFESKAHFDNCDFDAAAEYVVSLREEAGRHVEAAEKARAAGNDAKMREGIESAFFALGQALHALQDFYAHSNYVELSVPGVKRVEDVEILKPWRREGRERIRKLRESGLVSGYVFWGFPQRCPAETPSHGKLAKDTEDSVSGGVRVAHLRNLSQHRIAVYLARETSLAFLEDAYGRWPLLRQAAGSHVPLEIAPDRRGIPD